MTRPAAAEPTSFRQTERLNETASLETVNWHVVARCNYACRFCFYREEPFVSSLPMRAPATLTRVASESVLRRLAEAGVRRVNFAGGEPTLYPLLPVLARKAREHGMRVSIVTNGTGLTQAFIDACHGSLDAVKLSVESSSSEVEARLGRGNGRHVELCVGRASLVQRSRIPLMVNSVITSLNWKENLHGLIGTLQPVRWKVFQALPIGGQNVSAMRELGISGEQFRAFVERHRDLNPVAEPNELMEGSYVMLDPVGRFFQNSGGIYTLSRPILEVGVLTALKEVGWNREVFLARGGSYSLMSAGGEVTAGGLV